MEKYRIKEVNGKFIPQVRVWTTIFYSWEGIDNNFGTCFTSEYQYKYCALNTLEEAKERIKNYNPKYHKL